MNGPGPLPKLRPRARRRWLFRLIVLAGLAAVAEAASFAAHWALDGRPFSFSTARRQQHHLLPRPASPAPASSSLFHVVVHPYLGFCYDPTWPGKLLPGEDPATDWGFTGKQNRPPVNKRSPNKVIVGILGASVASIFAAQGVATLERELKRSPRFAGKDIEFVSLSVAAFKQPQQVMALNYALALGAEFDLVLNLDGLNEVAWYHQDNRASGASHLYPSGWHHLIDTLPDAATRRAVGKIVYLRECRSGWAALFHDTPLGRSVTANLVWKLRDRRLAADIASAEMALRGRPQEGLPYRARGPHNAFRDDEDVMAQLVADWERGSLLIDRTCKAHGIRYYGFLQPNQYVPGTKPLSAREKREAFWDQHPTRPWIEKGYPLLREAGRRLAARGVRFHDLSMAFAEKRETLYIDNCCHFNRKGNEVLAEAIARAIRETPEPPRALSAPAGRHTIAEETPHTRRRAAPP